MGCMRGKNIQLWLHCLVNAAQILSWHISLEALVSRIFFIMSFRMTMYQCRWWGLNTYWIPNTISFNILPRFFLKKSFYLFIFLIKEDKKWLRDRKASVSADDWEVVTCHARWSFPKSARIISDIHLFLIYDIVENIWKEKLWKWLNETSLYRIQSGPIWGFHCQLNQEATACCNIPQCLPKPVRSKVTASSIEKSFHCSFTSSVKTTAAISSAAAGLAATSCISSSSSGAFLLLLKGHWLMRLTANALDLRLDVKFQGFGELYFQNMVRVSVSREIQWTERYNHTTRNCDVL